MGSEAVDKLRRDVITDASSRFVESVWNGTLKGERTMRMRQRSGAACLTALLTCVALAYGCRAQGVTSAPSLRDEFRKQVVAGRIAGPLNPVSLGTSDVGKVQAERVRFTPEEGQDAIAVLNKPKGAQGRLPVVIVQHFLGATKDHLALTVLLNQLAQQGFLAAAIDGRYRGERQNGMALNAAILQSLRTGKGHPLFLDTAYDITRFIDYLQSRPDVDGERIGMTGISEGGVITWMSAVLDDRIKVAAPVIGVTCFGDTLRASEANTVDARTRLFDPILKDYATDLGEKVVNARVVRTAWEKLCPGMLDRFDAPQLVPLIAPRPLLIVQHEKDELFPVEGARKVEAVVRSRYTEQKAEDRFNFQVSPGLTHSAFSFPEVTAVINWMNRWLKTKS